MEKVINYFRIILVFFTSFLLTFICFTVLTAVVTAFAGTLLFEAMKEMYSLYTIITLVISLFVSYEYATHSHIIEPLELFTHEETPALPPRNHESN